jgi:hypothetical protein
MPFDMPFGTPFHMRFVYMPFDMPFGTPFHVLFVYICFDMRFAYTCSYACISSLS